MKGIYVTPNMEAMEFRLEDLIATSSPEVPGPGLTDGGTGNGDDGNFGNLFG